MKNFKMRAKGMTTPMRKKDIATLLWNSKYPDDQKWRMDKIWGDSDNPISYDDWLLAKGEQMMECYGGYSYTGSMTASPPAHHWKLGGNTVTVTGSIGGNTVTVTNYGSIPNHINVITQSDPPEEWKYIGGTLTVKDGQASKITLPDGTIIDVAADGSYHIDDKDAKVIYRANRVRDFNSYVNASDKLEEFIKFCGKEKLTKPEFMKLPIELFIAWLIIEAAHADGEPDPQDVQQQLFPKLEHIKQPHCISCGRFISRKRVEKRIEHCNARCFERYALKMAA